jgi:threonine aldolase
MAIEVCAVKGCWGVDTNLSRVLCFECGCVPECTLHAPCRCGGRVLKPDYVAKVASLCRDHGLALHMDGARIMNAAVALKVRVCGWVGFSVSVCVCVCLCVRARRCELECRPPG